MREKCHNFGRGLCFRGNTCHYFHPPEGRTDEICKPFQDDDCTRPKCKFLHVKMHEILERCLRTNRRDSRLSGQVGGRRRRNSLESETRSSRDDDYDESRYDKEYTSEDYENDYNEMAQKYENNDRYDDENDYRMERYNNNSRYNDNIEEYSTTHRYTSYGNERDGDDIYNYNSYEGCSLNSRDYKQSHGSSSCNKDQHLKRHRRPPACDSASKENTEPKAKRVVKKRNHYNEIVDYIDVSLIEQENKILQYEILDLEKEALALQAVNNGLNDENKKFEKEIENTNRTESSRRFGKEIHY